MMSALGAKMLGQVDDGVGTQFDVEAPDADGKTKLVTSESETSKASGAQGMAAAKSRIAVSIGIGGKRFDTTCFGDSGSKDAIKKVITRLRIDREKIARQRMNFFSCVQGVSPMVLRSHFPQPRIKSPEG